MAHSNSKEKTKYQYLHDQLVLYLIRRQRSSMMPFELKAFQYITKKFIAKYSKTIRLDVQTILNVDGQI